MKIKKKYPSFYYIILYYTILHYNYFLFDIRYQHLRHPGTQITKRWPQSSGRKKSRRGNSQGSPRWLIDAEFSDFSIQLTFWGIPYTLSQIICRKLTWMLRTYLRSVSGPLSRHVCLSCLARPGAPSLRQFHRISALRTNAGETEPTINSFDASTEPSVPPPNVCPSLQIATCDQVLTECVL